MILDADEANLLIQLIESLIDGGVVVRRHEREEHMQKVISAAQAKSAEKMAAPPKSN